METAATGPKPATAVDFLSLVGQLKLNKRTGWVNNGVHLPESISDHMYRMAVAAVLRSDLRGPTGDRIETLDVLRTVLIALAHDIAECITTDIVPGGTIDPDEKRRLEAQAMQRLRAMLEAGGFPRGAALLADSYAMYEAQDTEEARFVKSLDKFEMLLQAFEYENSQGCDLGDFFDSTPLSKIPHAAVRAWTEEVVRRRNTPRHKPSISNQIAGWLPAASTIASFGACFAAGAVTFMLFARRS